MMDDRRIVVGTLKFATTTLIPLALMARFLY
jgi:hypothetical protein